MRPCGQAGCPKLSADGYCDDHKRKPFRSRFGNKDLSSHQRGYGADWRRLREVVLSEEPACRMCKLRAAVICDHIKNKAIGGTDERTNLQGLCKGCHDAKTDRESRMSYR